MSLHTLSIASPPASQRLMRLAVPTLAALALAAVYVAAAYVGLRLAFVHGNVTAVWPPTGIAIAALFVFGSRLWPGVALGALIANGVTDVPLGVAAGIAAGNTLEALVGARLLHLAGARPALDRVRDAAALIVLAAALSTMVSATVGVASLLAGTPVVLDEVPALWTTWWLGDALGALVITPLLLAWWSRRRTGLTPRRVAEALAILGALLLMGGLLFGEGLDPRLADLRYLVFPLVILAAARLDARGAATATFVVSSIAIWGTVHGIGPFSSGSLNDSLLHLQAFMAVVALTGLVVAAVVAERAAAQDAQRFLAQASATLASSLDYEATLQQIAQLAVPAVADWCIVDIVEPDGQLRRVATAAADASKTFALDDLRARYTPTADSPQPAAQALRAGHPVLYDDFNDAALAATIRDGAHLALLRRLRPRSAIAAPLVARGQTLGAITLATSESGRRYEATHLILVEDLAGRCALAVDNARLYEAERAARREAERAVAVRDEFLSIAAHELRTPITSLRGYAQMLLRRGSRTAPGADGTDETHEAGGVAGSASRALETISQQAEKLGRLVSQLLDLTRIGAGRFSLEREEVDLHALATEVAANAQIVAAGSHRIVVRPPAEPVGVSADRLRLEQVLVNLVDNAVRYSPDGGEIAIEIASPTNGSASIAVRDQGLGIPVEHRERIFERFYQGNRLGSLSGMGLGLYVSQQIVERHGGTIEAEHPTTGGTRFVVTLPLAPPPTA